MALQKHQYRSSTNRSRGGGKTQLKHSTQKKDYDRNIRSFHGSNADAAMDNLSRQIRAHQKYG